MKKMIGALIISLLTGSFLHAHVINVPGDYTSIQAAIDNSVQGDTVLVAPGTYFENLRFRGKGITLASYYILNHDTSYISSTVINGGSPVHSDTGSCILMNMPDISTALDTSAAVIGFTLTDGTGSVFEDEAYPGYFYREGGGIFIQYWSPRIRFNRILNNHIDTDSLHPDGGGGGIRSFKGNPTIENNVILHNSGHCGTAINFYYSSGIIRNNIIAYNSGATVWRGGAIYTYSNYLTYPTIITNNTIVYNTVSDIICTGGLRLYNASYVTVKNNILWDNYPTQIYKSGGSNVTIDFNDFQGGYGTGNINVDPVFQSNTFNLNPSSQCIDAGDTNVIYNDPENNGNPGFALWPAQGSLRNDMGAFGGSHCALMGTAVVGIKDYNNNPKISGFILYQNYPNPFNPSTAISYQLPENGHVQLKIFNILGQEVRTLVDGYESSGIKRILWDGKDQNGTPAASGIYIYRLQIKTQNRIVTKSRKMILIK